MTVLSIRSGARRLLSLVVCASLALGGCVTTDADASQELTLEQRQLRAQRERWNQTALTGAVAGAALGAGIGALAGGSGEAALIGGLIGLVAGLAAGAAVADRNLKFENRELSAEKRIEAATDISNQLEQQAAVSEALVRSNEARLDALDTQYRAKQITAAKYRADAQVISQDLKLIKETAEDTKKARERLATSSTEVPQLQAQEPRLQQTQMRLEESARQLEAKLSRVPST
jgi:chromosome segregation ATPase